MLKQQKGITLVALVITIIVLLILAGITISLTLGERGLLNMAKEAKNNYANASQYESNVLANVYNEANYIVNGTNE